MNVKDRPRLGRGLKGLISVHPIQIATPGGGGDHQARGDTPGDHNGQAVLTSVALDLISPNPHQPREKMDAVALAGLAVSIGVVGVLQPVLLRPDPAQAGRYQLVAGHRRTAAARIAGLTHIPSVIRHDSTEETQAEWALIENVQRQDLNPIERARAYKAYLERFGLSQTQAAERLGEDRAVISNHLRLLDLNTGVQDLVARGLLSAGHAKVLAGVAEPAVQDALANRCITEGLNVRRLEELAAELAAAAAATAEARAAQAAAGSGGADGSPRRLTARSPHILELEQDLGHKLGTKVKILPAKRKNSGKIVIHYFSIHDFERITEQLGPTGDDKL